MADTQCWHCKYGPADLRCPEHGIWGWTDAAADKAGAAKDSILRRARWCKLHKHFDDQLLESKGEKTTTDVTPPVTDGS